MSARPQQRRTCDGGLFQGLYQELFVASRPRANGPPLRLVALRGLSKRGGDWDSLPLVYTNRQDTLPARRGRGAVAGALGRGQHNGAAQPGLTKIENGNCCSSGIRTEPE